MRIIDREAATALLQGVRYSNGNTTVAIEEKTLAKMYLHGNLIAMHGLQTGAVEVSLAGWPTRTTRSRVNAIAILLSRPDLQIRQSKGEQFVGDKLIKSTSWHMLREPDLPEDMR